MTPVGQSLFGETEEEKRRRLAATVQQKLLPNGGLPGSLGITPTGFNVFGGRVRAMTATTAETTYAASVAAAEQTKLAALNTAEKNRQINFANHGAAYANAQLAIDRTNAEMAKQASIAVAKDTLRGSGAGELALQAMGVGQQGFASSYEKPLGYQQITGMSSATGLSPPVGATMALIAVETQGVRWRDDGTNPTGSVGMPIAAGGSLTYYGNLNAVIFIQQSSGAVLDVSYYA